MNLREYPLIVVGSGLFGLTIAEVVTRRLGLKVIVFEKRAHIGGNAWSEMHHETGIEVHKYGSHLFHTSNEVVWNYLNNFSGFNQYQHRVWTNHQGRIYSLPVNLNTISSFFNQHLSPYDAIQLINSQRGEIVGTPRNLEEKAISMVGRPLYEALIRGYTLKQWDEDPRSLPTETISRLPVRFNFDNRYFQDKWEGLPLTGYAQMLLNMVANPLIEVVLETDFFDLYPLQLNNSQIIVYTGPIDRYFNYAYGHLNWRTLDFEFETHNTVDFQGTSVINYSDIEVPFTRIHEFRHLHPERSYKTNLTITAKEYSRKADIYDEPYYPVNSKEDRSRLLNYRELASKSKGVFFGGRLGTYQYLDMHMAVASALTLYKTQLEPILQRS